MHDGLDAIVEQQLIERGDLARSPTISRSAGTAARWPRPGCRRPTRRGRVEEQANRVRADVAGAAGDENTQMAGSTRVVATRLQRRDY